jgi:hypothetical protein
MPVSFFGLYRGDGTATADSLFGRRGNNPYSHYRVLKLPERGTHERTLMLGCVIALRYLGRLGVKLRNTQHEQMTSALPPRTDIGLDTQNITRIECYGTS